MSSIITFDNYDINTNKKKKDENLVQQTGSKRTKKSLLEELSGIEVQLSAFVCRPQGTLLS
jgi:hypothetical protein